MNRIAELNWIEFGVRFETGSFDKGLIVIVRWLVWLARLACICCVGL